MESKSQTLSEIALQYPLAVSIMEKYDLDYCCHGKQTLEEACEGDVRKYSIVQEALQQLREDEAANGRVVHFENLDLSTLISHIVNKHHFYVRESMPVIYGHLQKISEKHGERHPELMRIMELFKELMMEMNQHMKKEEHILFPNIVFLEQGIRSGKIAGNILMFSAPISVMEKEHENAGSILEMIKELTDHYTPPSSACTTYQLSFKMLKEFEADLHQHVHLENNILFPRAIKLQESVAQHSAN